MEEKKDLNLNDTELRLGLPGTNNAASSRITSLSHATKEQVVGWPPIRSYRKNSFKQQGLKKDENEEKGMMYVKVSMDGAPYMRKVDIKGFKGYSDLLKQLESMFKLLSLGEYSETQGYTAFDFVPTYQDKDGDWMLLGDVPWEMFMGSCKRLRIMKGSEAKGLASNI